MSLYKVDERDVHFNLFEYLKIAELTALEPFKEQNAGLYKMVMTEALKFTLNEIDPLYVSGDRESCRMENGKVLTPKGFAEAYKKFAENGFIAMDMPATFGGQGLPVLLNTAAFEFFTGANVPLLLYAALARGAAHLIETFGSEQITRLYCEKMYNGTWGGTMCLTEPQAGTSVGDIKTTARPLSDGTFSITGSKLFISGGDHDLTENIIHMVLARVEGDTPGTKGISLFAVPKIWVNNDGSLAGPNDVNCVNIEHKMGIKGTATCTLNFGEAQQCRGYIIGERSEGMRMMFQMMNEARLLCGLQGEALAATAYQNALAYAKDRVQGNDTTIIHYPSVRRNLALCRAYSEGMRGLIYLTGKLIDLSRAHPDATQKSRAQNRVDLLIPVCKAYCSDFGFKVTELALHTYGGYGYVCDYPAEQYMRDIKIASIYEGTNDVQAMDLMGRKLALKNGELFREYYEDLDLFVTQNAPNSELAKEIASFKKALDTVAQVALKIAEWGMGGDQNKPLLSANYFLEIVGHTTLAHILLDQALVAQKTIAEGKNDAFYRDKIRTAQFFVAHVLPGVQRGAKTILSEDVSALEMEF